jgi:hypothetical protein
MTTITELHKNVQDILTRVAELEARRTGFIRRERQLSGAGFAQAMILGGMQSPQATRSEQHQYAVIAGQRISAQGFEQRVEQASSVAFMKALLKETLTRLVVSAQPRTVFPAFNGVYLTDCTRLEWPGLGIKAGVRLDIQGGQMEVRLMELQDNDQKSRLAGLYCPCYLGCPLYPSVVSGRDCKKKCVNRSDMRYKRETRSKHVRERAQRTT